MLTSEHVQGRPNDLGKRNGEQEGEKAKGLFSVNVQLKFSYLVPSETAGLCSM